MTVNEAANKWDFLNDLQKSFQFDLKTADDEAVLTNRSTGESIEIIEEKYTTASYGDKIPEVYCEYIVCFSTQHRHFEDLSDAADYVRLILNDEVLPIEFYQNGERRFGGDIRRTDFYNLTAEFLSKEFCHSADHISQLEYEIHSWSGKYNIERRRFE